MKYLMGTIWLNWILQLGQSLRILSGWIALILSISRFPMAMETSWKSRLNPRIPAIPQLMVSGKKLSDLCGWFFAVRA